MEHHKTSCQKFSHCAINSSHTESHRACKITVTRSPNNQNYYDCSNSNNQSFLPYGVTRLGGWSGILKLPTTTKPKHKHNSSAAREGNCREAISVGNWGKKYCLFLLAVNRKSPSTVSSTKSSNTERAV